VNLAAGAFLVGAAALAAFPARAACYPESADAAEKLAVAAQDWGDVHSAFVRFGICDDGSVAKGFSDSIARILAEHWTTVSTLNRLATADPKFKRFVLRHIDTLMTPAQADTITRNTAHHCPPKSRALCAELAERVSKATTD
jgi:hypothetical protein